MDVGCGGGLALVGSARRLTTGRAVGLDHWSQTDLSDNSPDATWSNARAEGVEARVTVETGDAMAMPFADRTFDVVLSMTALHNIPSPEGRRRALAEILRVLKPNGRLSLFDIQHTRSYARDLEALGAHNVRISSLILLWLMPGWRLTADKAAG